MKQALLVLAVGLLLGADAADKEYASFEGTWVMVSAEENGKHPSKEFIEKSRLVANGKAYTVTLGDKSHKATFRLDPTKDPKHIDVKREDGTEVKAIYELNGDTFTICVHAREDERPREFSGKAGTEQRLHVWKRSKK